MLTVSSNEGDPAETANLNTTQFNNTSGSFFLVGGRERFKDNQHHMRNQTTGDSVKFMLNDQQKMARKMCKTAVELI